MIVLDEQLLGRGLEFEIAKWYRGSVLFINDIRPNTVIKDDAVPVLLRLLTQPAFITINTEDFWRKTPADIRYCMICFVLPDSRAVRIPGSLRELFHTEEFRTKSKRMGKVIRVTEGAIHYYSVNDSQMRTISR
jgi:hypothetical protein